MDYTEFVKLTRHVIKYELVIRAAIREARIDRQRKQGSGGHVPGRVSKPTEAAAIANLTPIKTVFYKIGAKKQSYRLDEPEKWLEAIESVRKTLSERDKAFMDTAFSSPDWSVCADFRLSRPTFYSMKADLTSRVALAAACLGLKK